MKNFRKDNGITLIALVVTIVVLLILAGITISTLFGENGIISAARRAEEDTRKDQVNTEQGVRNLENGMNIALEGGITSSIVESNPLQYYGQKVNYIAGNEAFQNDLGVDWKIFYADKDHIYLIASDYVPRAALPNSTNASGISTANRPLDGHSAYPKAAKFGTSTTDGVMQDYEGSTRVTDNVKYLNKSYFDYLETNNTSSTDSSMKAVAYMLDTKAWEGYKDNTGKADFVIGSPTIEILLDSYCKKNKLVNQTGANKYQTRVLSNTGYQISSDYGTNWYTGHISTILDSLSTTDSLYVITSTSNNAWSCWLASSYDFNANFVISIDCYGGLNYSNYANQSLGFRPLVALKSNVVLEEQEDGSFNIK